jgi:outer membrane receptor protein involved in Fe transport
MHRGGYTGYNIRGMESNRVGIDVDGIAQPNATGRGYVAPMALLAVSVEVAPDWISTLPYI